MPKDDNSTLNILHVTDTHLHATTDSRMRGVRTYDTFVSVLDASMSDTARSADAILVTGDIVQDESRAGYERFRSLLEPCGLPVLCIPGNHDDPLLMAELLNAAPFQVGGEARFDHWSIVLLNTFLTGEDAGGLGPMRLASLERSLQAHASQHVLVCMHHHPLPTGSRWLDGVALKDAEQFLQIIDEHENVAAVLCGHVHQASDRYRGRVRFMTTPSTCSQFLPHSEYFAMDDQPPGWRWIRLGRDGSLDTEVKWLERVETAGTAY